LDKIRKINFKQEDWECITVLITVLKPFYKATIMLQGQKYHSLSMSKVIETSLIKYYEHLSQSSESFLELTVSNKLNDYVKKYLVEKSTCCQKELSSVNFYILLYISKDLIYPLFR
jgi:hypothetical protein